MTYDLSNFHAVVEEEQATAMEDRETMRNLDVFVLDNSLRESTVGALKGHTVDNKWSIFEEVKKCGFKHIIVSAFSHMPRVDDVFVKQLTEKEQDLSMFYAFSEIGEGKDKTEFPVGLKKMMKYGLQNPVFEIDLDLDDPHHSQKMCNLLTQRIEFTFADINKDAKIFVNLRDLPYAMMKCPARVFEVVKFLSTRQRRIFGILFEEPTGRFNPELVAAWTKAIRRLMDECGWEKGHLLAHVHEKWGLAEATVAKCLSRGATGVWASVCQEGAALGHACSAVSIMNLIREGEYCHSRPVCLL